MGDRGAKNGLKLSLGLFVYGLTTAVVITAFAFWWAAGKFTGEGPLNESKTVTIERGQGLNAIARRMQNEGAIRNEYVFVFGARLMGAQGDLKAGEYELTPGMSARDIVRALRDHDVVKRQVTLREGLTSYEIVVKLNEVEELTPRHAKALPEEGSLLPQTYSYQLEDEVFDVLEQMREMLRDEVGTLCNIPDAKELEWDTFTAQPCGAEPLKTVNDVLTLASIVEKETGAADERAMVAGVFINRLKLGMALQTDPTVIYAITKGKHKNDGKGPLGRRLLSKDLEYDSPYNTYKYPGLPPGPIANAGLASIKAVLAPQAHDYIYFVADGSGGHAFAKTLAEHNANVAKWRKIRAAQ